VAMKMVQLGSNAEPVEARALQLMKQIRHAPLLAMFGAWQREGVLIVAMELAECTLMDRFNEAARQRKPGIERDQLLEYMMEAAKGIDFLNEPSHNIDGKQGVGIQHRDIKPQNLLLVGGSVKVGDFGLGKLVENQATGHTGALTVAYAAPEFFQGQTTHQSDQYSLAMTYCQLRGGRLPFTGTIGQIMAGHLSKPPD